MSTDPIEVLSSCFREAIGRALPDVDFGEEGPDPLISASKNPQHGDFQSNAAMPLAKRAGRKPRDVAAAIVKELDTRGLAEPVTEEAIAGPGFINVRLRQDALAELVSEMDTPDLGLGVMDESDRQTVVVDMVGVNLAKQMHVGHLRSMIIGDALARTLTVIGHEVIRQNHVGDWGLPIAMVTRRVMDDVEAGRLSMDELGLDDLDRLYRAAQQACAADVKGLNAAKKWWNHPKAIAELDAQVSGAQEQMARAKETLVKLQSGDEQTVAVWKRIADVTLAACLDTCRQLGIDMDDAASAGESSYADQLAGIVDDLLVRQVGEEDQGAVIVRNEGIKEPTIVRKGDGGFLYATTDLAAIRHRVRALDADRVIYCVDARQGLHFKQVFASAVHAGYAMKEEGGATARLDHAAFGTVLGEDGRPFKTRSGENVKLADLIGEAIERAGKTVAEKNPDLAADERGAVARAVAIAAIKYADLSTDRVRDYVFSFDRMLAFEGNTGPYLLYAVVRIRSIFRKAAEQTPEAHASFASAELAIDTAEEKQLALELLRFSSVVTSVAESLEPHRMCQYLYDLAGSFSSFFNACPVLKAADEATLRSRLRLCSLTERVLVQGLATLGIETVDRM